MKNYYFLFVCKINKKKDKNHYMLQKKKNAWTHIVPSVLMCFVKLLEFERNGLAYICG